MTTTALDEFVVVRCQLGEREAFRALVERWHGPVWTFLRRMLGDAARSDDLSQEVWLRVVRGLPGLSDPARFPAWLFTVARRVVVDELRQAYRRPDTDPHHPVEDIDPASDRAEIDHLLDRVEIDRALAALSPRDREAVVLFHLEGLPLTDVADILAVPPGR